MVVVVLVVVAIMAEDMDIWVGDMATLTQITNRDKRCTCFSVHMSDHGEEIAYLPQRLLDGL